MILNGKIQLNIAVKKDIELPRIEANGIRILGTQQTKPARKLGNIPINPLSLLSMRQDFGN